MAYLEKYQRKLFQKTSWTIEISKFVNLENQILWPFRIEVPSEWYTGRGLGCYSTVTISRNLYKGKLNLYNYSSKKLYYGFNKISVQ